MDRSNTNVQKTTLQVNSQYLKDILNEVIGTFLGISFNTKKVAINLPCRMLYHYRLELQKKLDTYDADTDRSRHLNLLLDFIKVQFKDTIAETENLLEQGMMSFEHLWTLFRPGCTIFSPTLGRGRAFALDNYQYGCVNNRSALILTASYIDFDGESFGTRSVAKNNFAYVGAIPVKNLAAFPLVFHPAPDQLKQGLIARGRTFERYAGMHFASYSGIALEGCDRINIDGRVVIDCNTYHRFNANEAFSVNAIDTNHNDESRPSKRLRRLSFAYDDGEDEAEDEKEGDDTNGTTHQDDALISRIRQTFGTLTDAQRLLTNAMVRGFSFAEKKWLNFFLDRLTAIEWNPSCFDQLVLPQAQKHLVRALVSEHVSNAIGFDDIVKNKGKGLVCLLAGSPGIGKTLTAECVAEYSKRPLFIVSSADLGTTASALDERLGKILDMASTWKAVLLIDEADVFLERRSLHDMQRNALVSIFLRVLEYYQGILFLTTNRVSTFDDAFKSRIHVPLKYNELPTSSRIQIWRNFLSKIEEGVDVDEVGYGKLGESELNGRQIKNVIRTAKSLARFGEKKLDLDMLQQVIAIQSDFEQEFDGAAADGANKSAPKIDVNGKTNGTI